MDASVLSVITLRPERLLAAFDATLRDVVLPALDRSPGFVFGCAARRGPDVGNGRILISMWASEAEASAALPAALAHLPADAEIVTQPTYRPVGREWYGSSGEPRILRVNRVRVHPGTLDEAVAAAARVGEAWHDGPASLAASAVAILPPDRYIGVTLWTAWDGIDEATAGNRHGPIVGPGDELWVAETDICHSEVIAWVRSGVPAHPRVAPLAKR